ncbi:MAG: HAD family hydrolase [Legionella sp.]|nr:MAG: HAD family hydrolase [Legionella sp.]
MLNRYKLVVFDWEGTLAENSLGYLLNGLSVAAERLHLSGFDLQTARQLAPLGLATAVKKLFPQAPVYQQEEVLREAQKILAESSTAVQLVPGAEDTVLWLFEAGMHLGIATNKGAQGLARVLQVSGLEAYFPITRSASDAPSKPCPQMLEEIMAAFDVTTVQTLMVGDSISDIEMAASIGVHSIGMDFFHTEEHALRAAGALHVFDNYHDLRQYIKDN